MDLVFAVSYVEGLESALKLSDDEELMKSSLSVAKRQSELNSVRISIRAQSKGERAEFEEGSSTCE